MHSAPKIIEKPAEQASVFIASVIAEAARKAVAAYGLCSLVLAGGSSPKTVYSILAKGDPTVHEGPLPWEHILLFWGDERCAGPLYSNFTMVKEHLLDGIEIPPSNVLVMPQVTSGAGSAAESYETTIRSTFYNRLPERILNGFPVFDIVLLGMGEDGHTASLFPGNMQALEEDERWVIDTYSTSAAPPGERITLTLPVINNAGLVIIGVSGEKKHAVARQVLAGHRPDLPVSRVKPGNGRMIWVLGT